MACDQRERIGGSRTGRCKIADLSAPETAVKAPDHTLADLSQLGEFDCIIDVRSPGEYAEDHLPGAVNYPVLDDEERVQVGTLYKQVSPFAARKLGAALISRNIARHLEGPLAGYGKSWRPLVYCWRGGQRSGAFTHILREIGWAARKLDGGYKTWRHQVLAELELLPAQLSFQVIGGPTGSGKSRLLEALAAQGAQVLHLEALAAHKGSVLGELPSQPQPGQKQFETRLYAALAACDPARPVFVEAESRVIGRLRLPLALYEAIGHSARWRVEAPLSERIAFLLRDYDYLQAPTQLAAMLGRLIEARGRETVAGWQAQAEAGHFASLVGELLTTHYDPLYAKSCRPRAGQSERVLPAADLSVAGIAKLASTLLNEC